MLVNRNLRSIAAGIAVRLRRCERGTATIEYGLLAALIAIASIQSLDVLGDTLEDMFERTADSLSSATGGPGNGGGSGGSSGGGADDPSVVSADEAPPPASLEE